MDCATIQRWFSPYLDGLLAAPERATTEEHLTSCVRCRRDLDSLKQMLASLRAMEAAEAPNLLPGIHAKLTPQPWWEKVVTRFIAPWPASLPWHGLALAGSAALIAILVVTPEYRVKRKLTGEGAAYFQLLQVPSQARQYGEYRDADRANVPTQPASRVGVQNDRLKRATEPTLSSSDSVDYPQGARWERDVMVPLAQEGHLRGVAGAPAA